ncbi:hypothetical protein D3C71_1333380 [compost metagenome]
MCLHHAPAYIADEIRTVVMTGRDAQRRALGSQFLVAANLEPRVDRQHHAVVLREHRQRAQVRRRPAREHPLSAQRLRQQPCGRGNGQVHFTVLDLVHRFDASAADVPNADAAARARAIAELLAQPAADAVEVGLAPVADEIQGE